MNEISSTDNLSEARWPTGDRFARVPDAGILPFSEATPPAAVGLLKNAVQGAHHTLDRLADRAAPAVRKLGERVSAANATLHAKRDQWRETGDVWVEDMRTSVRRKPLLSVAAAVALGAVIAVIARSSRTGR